MSTTLPSRAELPQNRTWDETSIFATRADWEAACTDLLQGAEAVRRLQGTLHEGPDALAGFLEESERLQSLLDKVYIYTTLLTSVDAGDQEAAAMGDRARGLAAQVVAALSFAEPELIATGLDTVRGWIQGDPRLERYAHWLDRLERRARHVRSAEVEELLGLAGDPLGAPRMAHGVLADGELAFAPAADRDGNLHPVAQSSYAELLTRSDRVLRQHAFESYADAYLGVRKTIAALLSGGVKRDWFYARSRGYQSSVEAALDSNDIPGHVVANVVDSFRAHVGIWHRYWRVRRSALGVSELRDYDARAVLAPDVKVSYEQAVDWISEGVRPLGEDYVEILRRGALEERWVDVYPNRGKRLGAFSTGSQGTHPFIMMSFGGNVFGLSTLAHELGHSMHTYFATHTQPFVYSDYGIFVAEVASNMHQALVRAHLLETQDDRNLQIAVLEEAMTNFHRYLLVMPTLCRLELEMHARIERGEPLTADGLSALIGDWLSEAYGGELVMDRERASML
ncbi:MAG: oligoendopeptidase F family protein, partial [Candidatus Dormibacteraeota bacterium]|nr:oligoendopeptidase F family protein [Candidatus Dormibacteraeota bacterium]